MKIKQTLSVLFYLKRKKASKDSKIPIYVRLTIDGLCDEISLGVKIRSQDWDNNKKQLRNKSEDADLINNLLLQTKADIQNHFIVLKAHMILLPRHYSKKTYLGSSLKRESKVHKKPTLIHATDETISNFEAKVKKGKRSTESLKKWRTTKCKYRHLQSLNNVALNRIIYLTDSLYEMNPNSLRISVILKEDEKKRQVHLFEEAGEKTKRVKSAETTHK